MLFFLGVASAIPFFIGTNEASLMSCSITKLFDTINLPKRVERSCREEHSKEQVGKGMTKTFEEVVKKLETMIEGIRKDKPNDYVEGVIDGIIIAIRTIET